MASHTGYGVVDDGYGGMDPGQASGLSAFYEDQVVDYNDKQE